MRLIKYTLVLSCFLLSLILSSGSLIASHVVGGNLTYKCLGNSRYEVTLEFRRDCFNGAQDAQFDNPASIGIFDQNGFLIEILGNGGQILIPFAADDTLNETLTSECNVIGGDVCVQTTTYRDTIILPFRTGGYFLAYQRCCRNFTLNNIQDPLNTGATYWIRVTELALQQCNSSPTFNDWPDIYICADEPLVFDHSASDIDGDSLVYELCIPSQGASRDFPNPKPPGRPPYQPITWQPGFGLLNLLGGTQQPLTINAETGVITAIPEFVGQYLVGVCVREFRNGELLSEVRRDLQYNVRVCGRSPVVSFETDPPIDSIQCDGLEVQFVNESTSNFLPVDSLEFTWYFDWPDNTLISNEKNPLFTFPQPGLYTIALIGFDGTCADTSYLTVGLSTPDDPLVDFSVESSDCDQSTVVYLYDETTTVQEVLEYRWHVIAQGIDTILFGPEPTLEIFNDQDIDVTLEVKTISGCNGSKTETLTIETDFFEYMFQDQIICDGEGTVIFTNPNPLANIEINPSVDVIDNGDGTYSIENYTLDTDFIITITDQFCFDEDTVTINTVPEPIIEVESLIQCGNDTVMLNPGGNPDYFYVWSSDFPLSFNENEVNPIVSVDQTTQFYLTVFSSEGTDCVRDDSLTVTRSEYPEFEFFPSENIVTCIGDTLIITVNTTDDVVWTTMNGAVLGTGPELILPQVIQSGVITATVTNELGCSTEKMVRVNLSTEPDFAFTPESEFMVCSGDDATLEIISTDSIVWTDPMGEVLAMGNTITIDSVTELTALTVTAYNIFGCPGAQDVEVGLHPDPSYSVVDSSFLNVCTESSTTFAVSTTDSVVWYDLEGEVLGTGLEVDIINIAQDSQFIINVINEFGCLVSDTFSINEQALPEPDTISLENLVVCKGSDNTFMVNSQDSVTWLTLDEIILATGNSLSLSNITEDTTYQVLYITSDGCAIRDTFDIIIQSDINLEITTGELIMYCAGNAVNLTATTTEVATIEWYDESGSLVGLGQDIQYITSGDQQVIALATDTLGCIEMDTINVMLSTVEGELEAPDQLCVFDTIVLEFIPDDPTDISDIVWEPADQILSGQGNLIAFASPLETTEFTVIVTDTVGCSETFTATVNVGGFIIDLNATVDPEEILLGESAQLDVDTDPGFMYEWSPTESLDDPFISNPVTTPEVTTTFVVTVTDDLGCTGTDEITLNVIQPNCDESDVFVPNMFTPNNDGLNDFFKVESNFIDEIQMIIYNRLGQEVYKGDTQSPGWDGRFNGTELPSDVFGYHVMVVCINGFTYQTQGNVTLLR